MTFSKFLILLVIFQCTLCFSSVNIDNLLFETETVRTSNANLFNENLKKLILLRPSLSSEQSDLVDYLIFYQQGYNGEFTKSLANFETLFKRSNYLEIKFRAKAKIANVYIISGEYYKALEALDFVLVNFNNIENWRVKQLGFKIASTVYFLIEENELANKFSNLLLNNNSNANDKCIAYSYIASIKLRQSTSAKIKQDDSINKLLNKSISACEEINETIFSNLTRLDWYKYKLNQAYVSKEIYKSIQNDILKHENQIEKTNYGNLINIKNSLLARTYWNLGNSEKAVEFANKTLSENISINNTSQRIDVLLILSEYYQEMHEYDKSIEYLKQKNNTERLHFNNQKTKLMAYQTVKHNNFAKTYEIEFLNNKNKLMSTQMSLSEKTDENQKLVILFMSAFVAFGLFWAFKTKKIQENYKHLSETDGMTGIYNRKGLKDFMSVILHDSKKNDKSVAYAIFDLDNFKKINDKYGHIKGDWVIKKVIKQCQLIQNNLVTIGRIGGEEFAIAMRDSTSDDLSKFSEECRKLITDIDSSDIGCDIPISASFGVTSTDLSGYVLSSLMQHADKAMYDAKTAGRNMVVNYKYNQANNI